MYYFKAYVYYKFEQCWFYFQLVGAEGTGKHDIARGLISINESISVHM
jgi:hypothetical protein